MTYVATIPTQLCHLDGWPTESGFGLEVIHLSSSHHPLARTSPEARPVGRRPGMCPSVPGDAGMAMLAPTGREGEEPWAESRSKEAQLREGTVRLQWVQGCHSNSWS